MINKTINLIKLKFFLFKRKMALLIRRLKSYKVQAVFEEDLDDLLIQLDLSEKIKQGKFKCLKCGCTITRENLGIIENINGAIQISCLSTNCIRSTNSQQA